MKCITMLISGKLKGSGFSVFSLDMAEKYGVNGFVEYQKDGSIMIKAEGRNGNLNKFVTSCIRGPERSYIEYVSIQSEKVANYKQFRIQNIKTLF